MIRGLVISLLFACANSAFSYASSPQSICKSNYRWAAVYYSIDEINSEDEAALAKDTGLNQIISTLLKYESFCKIASIKVTGHSSAGLANGKASTYSKENTQLVWQALKQHGVSEDIIEYSYNGDEQLFLKTNSHHFLNNRVEILVRLEEDSTEFEKTMNNSHK